MRERSLPKAVAVTTEVRIAGVEMEAFPMRPCRQRSMQALQLNMMAQERVVSLSSLLLSQYFWKLFCRLIPNPAVHFSLGHSPQFQPQLSPSMLYT